MTNINFNQELQSLENEKAFPPMWAEQATHYFENQFGEQWIAIFQGGVIKIAGLDIGWKEIVLSYENVMEYLEIENNMQFYYQSGFDRKLEKEFEKRKASDNPLFKWGLNQSERLWAMSVLHTYKYYFKEAEVI